MPDEFAFCGRCGTRLDAPGPSEGERQVTCVFAGAGEDARSLAERAADAAREADDDSLELEALSALVRFEEHPGRRVALLRRALETSAKSDDLVGAAERCAELAELATLRGLAERAAGSGAAAQP